MDGDGLAPWGWVSCLVCAMIYDHGGPCLKSPEFLQVSDARNNYPFSTSISGTYQLPS